MEHAYQLAERQLREVAAASDGVVEVQGGETCSSGYQFDITVAFDGHVWVEDGLRVRARERFLLVVPPTFPYEQPHVFTPHLRFAGFPHVQWGNILCLYASPADWRPQDGMYGLIERLDKWIRDAALNRLDPADAPLHPPVADPTVDRLVIPIADTPQVRGSAWDGFATLRERNHRTEITGWSAFVDGDLDHYAPSILLHKPLPFEYPESVKDLLDELEDHGIDYAPFVSRLATLANRSSPGTPLTLVIGSPMRRVEPGGPALQHLAVWEISATDTDKLREMASVRDGGDAASREAAITAVWKWSLSAKVGWCKVHEMRPEVTRRRDHSSPMAWFRGKRVAIWGCGAIGTHVAESVVRAGAAHIQLTDNGLVNPGILVRQGFEDADIGRKKVTALADRLQRVDPDVTVEDSFADLIAQMGEGAPIPDVDLVIDCTASPAVRMRLEQQLHGIDSRPPIAALAIDSHAATGMATLARSSHSGGTLDVVRRLKLEACRNSRLAQPLAGFWPESSVEERFQPEPGCSEPTFVGSNADLASLSARMLNAITRALPDPDEQHTAIGWFVEEAGPIHDFVWRPDYSAEDQSGRYTVRVSHEAVREMRAWARRSARTDDPSVETGGLIFGEINEAASVIWITDVDGPPPDSDASDRHFTCGVLGTRESAELKHRRFRGSAECLGSWHTHPLAGPRPSPIDLSTVTQLLEGPESSRRTLVLLILSGDPDGDPLLGAHVFRTNLRLPCHYAVASDASETISIGPAPVRTRDVGLALSGGGSRAVAFHLGCFRALHDLGLLDRLEVISSVSGGSVIAAMYAYSSESFSDFDDRVVELLRRGLQRNIVREALRPNAIRKAGQAQFKVGAASIIRLLHRPLRSVSRLGADRRKPPPVRTFSRSDAFLGALKKSLFGNTLMSDVARDSLDTVINATELRTGSAFRFGSRQSGCWRFGTIAPEEAFVADAVAASAAYPALLPALDRSYRFLKKGVASDPTRVLLADGGVFENLGVSPIEPGREPSISTNAFNPDYIICCDAGTGLFDNTSYPMCWPTRMHRSFLTVFRKMQDATRNRLHRLAHLGDISGFALSYLGQRDNTLPWIPPGLPRRADVQNYPTDFAAMKREDIDRLALRGELLTRFLAAYYLPDL
ncbi:ThiF family adenylyltransferase [Candidatus Palauibacter sp.]|uniref:ThiF family adenylyltransferase n=1 Tax=Candidatus Palauibacter sp. TaxID=3101350 RepID=UPI003B01F0DF